MCDIEYSIDKASNYPQLASKLVVNYIRDHYGSDYPVDSVNILSFCYILGGWKATLVCPAWDSHTHFLVEFDKHSFEVHVDEYVCANRHIQSCEINE